MLQDDCLYDRQCGIGEAVRENILGAEPLHDDPRIRLLAAALPVKALLLLTMHGVAPIFFF